MENLTLTRVELRRLLNAFALVFLACVLTVWALLWQVLDAAPEAAAARSIGIALTLTSGLFFVFVRWVWRNKWIAKWMGRPVLRGVWLGYLSSDYKKTPSDTGVMLPIVFVIRQTYLTISIQSLTERQTGESRVEALIRNARTEATRLAYLFELKQAYPGEQRVTGGAGDLQLLSQDNVLRGTYWTSSPTHGTLSLKFLSHAYEGIETFEDAKRRWPIGPVWKS